MAAFDAYKSRLTWRAPTASVCTDALYASTAAGLDLGTGRLAFGQRQSQLHTQATSAEPSKHVLQVSFVVEDDAEAWGARDTNRKAYISACITLTLGVLGR